MEKGDVQKIVLRTIYLNGGTANTKEIIEKTGFKYYNVHTAADHLINRRLIRKKTIKTKEGWQKGNRLCIFTLEKINTQRIIKILKEFEEGENKNDATA